MHDNLYDSVVKQLQIYFLQKPKGRENFGKRQDNREFTRSQQLGRSGVSVFGTGKGLLLERPSQGDGDQIKGYTMYKG